MNAIKHKRFINKLWIIASVITLFLINGCSEDTDRDDDISSSNIQISPYILKSNTVRMTGSTFEKQDAIGIFAVADVNNDGQNTIDDSYAYNIENIYDGFDWQVASGQSLPWYQGNTEVTLYAYYPYQTIANKDDLHKLPFSVNTDQSVKKNFGTSDFLWSKSSQTAPTKEKVGLSFSHSLSKIRVNLKMNNGFPAETIENGVVNIINTLNDATIDLGTGKATVVDNQNTTSIKAAKLVTPDTGYDVTFEAIVIPQNINLDRELISIRSTEDATPIQMKAQSSVKLEPQKQYTFSYTIERAGVSVVVEDVEDWNSGGIYDGQIDTRVYDAVDLSNIDWETSRVYKIYSGKTLVGEATKEYLYKNGVIDRQAIVVYPILTTGKADLTKGFVAQVMNATLDTSMDYSTDTNSKIHGGSVSFDLATNKITTYQAGTSTPINRVVIDGSKIFAAKSSDLDALTLSPHQVTDGDKNNYGIVKIGVQYWMKENLKTEHYTDGSAVDVSFYNNNTQYKNIFGGLYSWNSINSTKLCPTGTGIPTYSELGLLANYVNLETGKNLKKPVYWPTIANAANKSGFAALPAGYYDNSYTELYETAIWWTLSPGDNNATTIKIRYLIDTSSVLFLGYAGKKRKMSVRCILK